jgi:hypothetical protein
LEIARKAGEFVYDGCMCGATNQNSVSCALRWRERKESNTIYRDKFLVFILISFF